MTLDLHVLERFSAGMLGRAPVAGFLSTLGLVWLPSCSGVAAGKQMFPAEFPATGRSVRAVLEGVIVRLRKYCSN